VLADYAVVPKELVTPIDDRGTPPAGRAPEGGRGSIDDLPALSPAQLATAIRFSVPYGGWLRGRLAAGETAVVTGATGSYGSAAVLLALALGAARVVAAGRDPEALAAITRDRVVPVRLTGDRVTDTAALRAAAGGGAHVVLDLVGTATDPNATLAGLHALRRNGRLVLMGSATAAIPLDYMALLVNNWEILGQFMYPASAYRRLLDLLRSGLLDISPIRPRVGLLDLTAITPHCYALADLPAAMAAASTVGSLACVVMTP
jgi:alcohol dehydrogenase